MRTIFKTLALGLALVAASAVAQPSPNPPAATLAALKAGGNTVVMRHGVTFPDQYEADVYHLERCSKQRQLNIAGKAQASTVGVLFQLHGIKLASITTSKLCRAIETGERIGEPQGLETKQSDDFTEGNQVVSPNENRRRATALKNAVSATVAAGTNVLIVTHKPNIVDGLGTTAFPFLDIGEGEILVYKAGALFGRLKLADLQALTQLK